MQVFISGWDRNFVGAIGLAAVQGGLSTGSCSKEGAFSGVIATGQTPRTPGGAEVWDRHFSTAVPVGNHVSSEILRRVGSAHTGTPPQCSSRVPATSSPAIPEVGLAVPPVVRSPFGCSVNMMIE